MEASETQKNENFVNSFTFYRSFFDSMAGLKKMDRLTLLDAVCKYGLDGTEPTLSGTCLALFLAFKPSLDSSRRNVKSGALGGRGNKSPLKGALKGALKGDIKNIESGLSSYSIGKDRIGDIYTENKAPLGIQGALAADQAQADQALAGTDPVTMPEALGWAARIGMAPAEVSRWFDYWGMRSWIPNGASRPMDRAAALRSMKPWNERRHEFKPSDERELGRGDNYDAPSPEDWNK